MASPLGRNRDTALEQLGLDLRPLGGRLDREGSQCARLLERVGARGRALRWPPRRPRPGRTPLTAGMSPAALGASKWVVQVRLQPAVHACAIPAPIVPAPTTPKARRRSVVAHRPRNRGLRFSRNAFIPSTRPRWPSPARTAAARARGPRSAVISSAASTACFASFTASGGRASTAATSTLLEPVLLGDDRFTKPSRSASCASIAGR